jgi:hypothetical protein
MSESAISRPSFDPGDKSSLNPQIISFDAFGSEYARETGPIRNGAEIENDKNDTWPLLDSRMNDEEIISVAETWNPARVYHGKQNVDRPQAAVEWMLVQTHVTVDTTVERDLRNNLAERDRRQKKGLTLTKAQRSLRDLTPAQTEKLETARLVNLKVRAAEERIEAEKEKGISNLLDVLEGLEAYVLDKCADANVVRLFNAVDDKMGGKNRELIIAKRTLVFMFADELPAVDA